MLKKILIDSTSNMTTSSQSSLQKSNRLESITTTGTSKVPSSESLIKTTSKNLISINLPKEPQLSVESKVSDFREFQKTLSHPAIVLNILPKWENGGKETGNKQPENENSMPVTNSFEKLCEELLSSLGELEVSIEEMTIWKDGFLKTTVPSGIKLQLTLLFARLFRSKSDLHEPLFELIKQVKMYSKPWMDKQTALMELEKDYKRQALVLDVAIRKLEQLQMQLLRLRSERRVHFWTRVTKRLLEYTHIVEEEQALADAAALKNLNDQQLEDGLTVPNTSDAHFESKIETRGDIKSLSPFPPSSASPLKDLTKEYVFQDESLWKQQIQAKSKKLRQIVRYHFPSIKRLLTQKTFNPFPSKPYIEYPSIYNNLFKIRLRHPGETPLRRAWSEINLSSKEVEKFCFISDKYSFREYREGLHEEMTFFEVEKRIENSKHARANSFNAVWRLGDSRRTVEEPLVALEDYEKRNKRNATSRNMNELENDFESESCGSSVDDIPYFETDDEITDVLKHFMESRSFMRWKTDADDDANEHFGIGEKDEFSLKEVMELTLLHAQQMQLLHHEYETRNKELSEKINELENQRISDHELYEKKLQAANERVQRMAAEYKEQQEKAAASAALALAASARTAEEIERSAEYEDNESLDENYRSRSQHWSRRSHWPKRKKTGWKERRMSKRKAPIHLHKKTYVLKNKPVFSGAQFSMKFLERLRWFTEQNLEKRSKLAEKIITREMKRNEQRLATTNLIIGSDSGEAKAPIIDIAGGNLFAEFMPFPGNVPVPKHREAWVDRGIGMPWGGKFYVNAALGENAQERKINILNLFDVAMAMNQKPSSQAQ
ncbi:hypothetical protein HK098_005943 [Nowakowskiella sp. JEL0407]|nr:hypothetical protein HK098_005943 [Nowakowskiella sp. JEL0407]